MNEATEQATSEILNKVKVIDTKKYNDFCTSSLVLSHHMVWM